MCGLTTKLCHFHIAGIYLVDVLTIHYVMCQEADDNNRVAKGQSVYNNVFLILGAVFVKVVPPNPGRAEILLVG